MSRIGKTREYVECAAMGLTHGETAKKCGVTVRAVWEWATKNGITFNGHARRDTTMTPAQKADYQTYVKAGISSADAIAKATAPRVKIRAVPKGMGAK